MAELAGVQRQLVVHGENHHSTPFLQIAMEVSAAISQADRVANVFEQIMVSCSHRISEHEYLIAQLCKSSHARDRELREQLAVLEQDKHALEQALAAGNKETAGMERRMVEKEQAIASCDAEISRPTSELAEARKQGASLLEEEASLRTAMREREEEVVALRGQVEELHWELESLTKTLEFKCRQCGSDSEIDGREDARCEVCSCALHKTEAEKEAAYRRERHDRYEEEMTSLRTQVAAMESRAREMERAMTDKEAQLDGLRQELSAAGHDREQLQQQVEQPPCIKECLKESVCQQYAAELCVMDKGINDAPDTEQGGVQDVYRELQDELESLEASVFVSFPHMAMDVSAAISQADRVVDILEQIMLSCSRKMSDRNKLMEGNEEASRLMDEERMHEMARLQGELEQVHLDKAAIQAALIQAEAVLNSRQEHMAQLCSQLEGLQPIALQHEQQAHAEAVAQVYALQTESVGKAEDQAMLEQMTTQLQAVTRERDDLAQRSEDLVRQLSETRSQKTEAELRLENWKASSPLELEFVRQEMLSVSEKLQDLALQNTNLRRERECLIKTDSEARRAQGVAEEAVARLEQHMDELGSTVTHLEARLTEAREHWIAGKEESLKEHRGESRGLKLALQRCGTGAERSGRDRDAQVVMAAGAAASAVALHFQSVLSDQGRQQLLRVLGLSRQQTCMPDRPDGMDRGRLTPGEQEHALPPEHPCQAGARKASLAGDFKEMERLLEVAIAVVMQRKDISKLQADLDATQGALQTALDEVAALRHQAQQARSEQADGASLVQQRAPDLQPHAKGVFKDIQALTATGDERVGETGTYRTPLIVMVSFHVWRSLAHTEFTMERLRMSAANVLVASRTQHVLSALFAGWKGHVMRVAIGVAQLRRHALSATVRRLCLSSACDKWSYHAQARARAQRVAEAKACRAGLYYVPRQQRRMLTAVFLLLHLQTRMSRFHRRLSIKAESMFRRMALGRCWRCWRWRLASRETQGESSSQDHKTDCVNILVYNPDDVFVKDKPVPACQQYAAEFCVMYQGSNDAPDTEEGGVRDVYRELQDELQDLEASRHRLAEMRLEAVNQLSGGVDRVLTHLGETPPHCIHHGRHNRPSGDSSAASASASASPTTSPQAPTSSRQLLNSLTEVQPGVEDNLDLWIMEGRSGAGAGVSVARELPPRGEASDPDRQTCHGNDHVEWSADEEGRDRRVVETGAVTDKERIEAADVQAKMWRSVARRAASFRA